MFSIIISNLSVWNYGIIIDEFNLNSAHITLNYKKNINAFINYCESNNIKYTQDHENPLIFIIYF